MTAVLAPVRDFRLTVGAITAWLLTALALPHSASWSLWALGGASVVGVSALVGAARTTPAFSALALAAFCGVLVLAPLSVRLDHAEHGRLAELARARTDVTAELTVTSDARTVTAKGVAGSARIAVDATVDRLVVAGRPIELGGRVLVLGPAAGWDDLLPGQRVRIDAELQPSLDSGLLEAVVAADDAPTLIGRPPWWQRAAGRVRDSLRRSSSTLPPGPAGLLPGLVDGDTRDLDPVLAERFRIAGLTHLVAVSGTNCSIMVGAVLLLMRRFRVGPRTSAAIGFTVLLAFVIVARPSPSVLRAALMTAITLFGLACGRERDTLPALSATVLVLLVWQPALALDLGFILSVLATSALILIAPGWAMALRRRRVPAVLAEGMAVAAAAHVVTAPVIAGVTGQVSLVAIPANLLAEPVVAAATVLGFLAAVVAPFTATGGAALAQLAGLPCRWLIVVADYFGGLHGATVPWPTGLVSALGLLAGLLVMFRLALRAGVRRMLVAAGVVVVVVQIPVRAVTSGWPAAGWIFVACDVGQGDGLVLPDGPHAPIVIDAGPDPVAMNRCLDDLGITDVPLLDVQPLPPRPRRRDRRRLSRPDRPPGADRSAAPTRRRASTWWPGRCGRTA